MTISRRIGPYIIGGTTAPLRRADATPTFVMMVDCSPAYYAQMRAEMGPDVLIEMRWTEPNDYQPLDDPERRADEWWARRQGAILAIPASDRVVFAGYNEIGTESAAAFCRFELRRLAHLHAAGRHAAVGSWGVGHPDLPEWVIYAPLRMAMRAGDVWDVHEYASDLADIDNRWHVGRFTLPAVAANLGDWPIVVSEYGYDYTPDTGKGQPGWQLTTDATGCLAMLRKGGEFYDSQKRVVGVGAYQMGSIDPKFYPFNMFGVWPTVVGEYGAAVVSPIPAAIPAPPIVTPAAIVLVPPLDAANIVRITQRFTPSSHFGIDYSCVVGKPVYAAIDGVAYRGDQGAAGFGRYIRIETYDERDVSLYVYTAHLSAWMIGDGDEVQAGDLIGLSGNTGNSTGPHLHFEVRRGSRLQASAFDPEPLIGWPMAPPFLPTNDPFMQARVTPQERYEGIRWWLEERKRQHEAGDEGYADAIDVALIEQMYKWEQE